MTSSTRKLVYVVDDDADVLGSLRFLLETDGFEVRTFRSSEALLDTPTSEGADCFVIDYKMPGMTGIKLTDVLRSRKIDAPVILFYRLSRRKYSEQGRGGGHQPRAAQASRRGKPRGSHPGPD